MALVAPLDVISPSITRAVVPFLSDTRLMAFFAVENWGELNVVLSETVIELNLPNTDLITFAIATGGISGGLTTGPLLPTGLHSVGYILRAKSDADIESVLTIVERVHGYLRSEKLLVFRYDLSSKLSLAPQFGLQDTSSGIESSVFQMPVRIHYSTFLELKVRKQNLITPESVRSFSKLIASFAVNGKESSLEDWSKL